MNTIHMMKHCGLAALFVINGVASASDLGTCSQEKIQKANLGDSCQAGEVVWKVEVVADHRVYHDMKSGLKVGEIVAIPDNGFNSGYQEQAEAMCSGDFRLPTGYELSDRGKWGFPASDSDVTVLVRDGLRDVVPGCTDHFFWTSSVPIDERRCYPIVDAANKPIPPSEDTCYVAYTFFDHNFDEFGLATSFRSRRNNAVMCVSGFSH